MTHLQSKSTRLRKKFKKISSKIKFHENRQREIFAIREQASMHRQNKNEICNTLMQIIFYSEMTLRGANQIRDLKFSMKIV